MLRQFSSKRIFVSFAFDWLGTVMMLLLATYLNSGSGGLPEPVKLLGRALGLGLAGDWETVGPRGALSVQVALIVCIIWPFFFIVFSVYDGRRNPTFQAELLNIFMATVASTLALAGALYLTYRETSRALFITFFALDLTLLLGGRILWWLYRRGPFQNKTNDIPILIVGAGIVGQQVAAELQKYATRGMSLIGFVDDDQEKQKETFVALPVLGTLDKLPELVCKHRIQDVVIALPLHAHRRMVEICHQLQRSSVHVHVVPDLFALSFPGSTLDGFGGIPVIDLGQPGIHGRRRLIKRLFDVLAVSAGLILLFPLMFIVAVIIKLDSPGPVLYQQTRIGENGRAFTMFKFRSMQVNADSTIHKKYVTHLIQQNVGLDKTNNSVEKSLKIKEDPRITRMGRLIRKTSIDELPQLWNVLRGDMSLVGPRPPLPYEVEVYKEWHKRRLEVLPGITGPWQIKARNRVSFDEMVRMDLAYIEQQSFWLDLLLILQTPWAMVKAQGAG